jgi:hypothetical protein
MKKHTGECPNCKNWNDSYRSQVPCHKCKNTRQVELPGCEVCKSTGKCDDCKGSKICYNCKGKGYFDPFTKLNESDLIKLPKPNACSVEIKVITGASHSKVLSSYIFNDTLFPNYFYDKKAGIILDGKKNRIAMNIIGNYYSIISKNYTVDELRKDASFFYDKQWESFNSDMYEWKRDKIFFKQINRNKNYESAWLLYDNKMKGCEEVANALLTDPSTKKMFLDKLSDSKDIEKEGVNQIKKTVYIYNGVDDDTDFGTVQSSDNKECKDFPFTLGCVNDYIGDINEKFFGKGRRRANVFSTALLKQLQSYGFIVPSNKEPKITEDIYNDIMKSFTKDIIKTISPN